MCIASWGFISSITTILSSVTFPNHWNTISVQAFELCARTSMWSTIFLIWTIWNIIKNILHINYFYTNVTTTESLGYDWKLWHLHFIGSGLISLSIMQVPAISVFSAVDSLDEKRPKITISGVVYHLLQPVVGLFSVFR